MNRIVNSLLENEVYGPPAPDKFLNAIGSTRQLMDLQRRQAKTMIELDRSLQMERQLRKHGVTRDQVSHYLRADAVYPNKYLPSLGAIRRRGALPPDAIVGMKLNDGREIMFDMAVMPEK